MRFMKCAAAFAVVFASVAAIAPAARALGVKPAAVNFGTVALEKTKAKTITIEVDPGYHVNAIIGAGLPFSQTGGTCTATATKCKAYFTPMSVGVDDGTVIVRECTPTFTCQDFGVAVHGVGGVLRATPVNVDFGSVAVNTEKAKAVAIRLDPGFHLVSVGSGAPFPQNIGTCTPTSTRCKATVFFAPTSPGTFDSTFTAKECDPAFNCGVVSITLHGVGA